MSAASPSLEDVFEQCCDMDASLAERLATFAEAVRMAVIAVSRKRLQRATQLLPGLFRVRERQMAKPTNRQAP